MSVGDSHNAPQDTFALLFRSSGRIRSDWQSQLFLLLLQHAAEWCKVILDEQLTSYPAALRCNPSIRYATKDSSWWPAASQSRFQTSTWPTSCCVPISRTASAYSFVVANNRSSASGGSRDCRSASLWYVLMGGGVKRITLVQGE